MNYGMYTNDNAAADAINLCGEYSYGDSSVNCPKGRTACQFKTLWGFSMYPYPYTLPFALDMHTICQNLYVITNNALASIGGPGVTRLQPLAAPAVDPGVITLSPMVNSASLSLSHVGLVAGQLVGQVTASQSPFWWVLTGTGASNFWIQPTTGLIYVSTAGVSGIAAGTYILTATAQNVVGSGTGSVTIVVG